MELFVYAIFRVVIRATRVGRSREEIEAEYRRDQVFGWFVMGVVVVAVMDAAAWLLFRK